MLLICTDRTSVFEGVVVEKGYLDRLNAIKVEIAVSMILYGLESETVLMEVYTPLSKNGVEFEVGGKYRVAAVKMKEEFWTWIWMGTYAL